MSLTSKNTDSEFSKITEDIKKVKKNSFFKILILSSILIILLVFLIFFSSSLLSNIKKPINRDDIFMEQLQESTLNINALKNSIRTFSSYNEAAKKLITEIKNKNSLTDKVTTIEYITYKINESENLTILMSSCHKNFDAKESLVLMARYPTIGTDDYYINNKTYKLDVID